ncbi:MAG: Gfo/Idh/MocA family oxidoreductase [Planctomycetota bacterium]
MPKTLGALVIGTGWVAGEHIKAYMKNPNTEIRGLCDIIEGKAESVGAQLGIDCAVGTDYKALVRRDDIDVISICSINSAHFAQAKTVIEAGKHVLVEKPLCFTFDEARELKKLTLEKKVKTGVGFVARWYSAIKGLKKIFDRGLIGEPFYIESDYWHQIAPGWKSTAETAGSCLLMAGCHAVDLVRYFQKGDAEPTEVFGYSVAPSWRKDFTYEPTISFLIKFDNGSVGKVASSLEANMPYAFHLQVMGTEGAIRERKVYSEKLLGDKLFMDVPGVYPDDWNVTHHPFDEEIDHLIDCIINDKEPMISILDAYKTYELVFAAELSAETGKPVKLPLG